MITIIIPASVAVVMFSAFSPHFFRSRIATTCMKHWPAHANAKEAPIIIGIAPARFMCRNRLREKSRPPISGLLSFGSYRSETFLKSNLSKNHILSCKKLFVKHQYNVVPVHRY